MRFRSGLLALLAFSACSSSDYRAPVSEAGTDQIVARDARVQLDGTASTDSDGEIATWNWTLLSAPVHSQAAIEIDPENPALASFVSDRDGVYTIILQVSDNDGLRSVPDVIRVVAQRPNDRPIAVMTASGSAGVGETLLFDGSASWDPEESALSYQFELVLAPKDSLAVLQESGGEFASLRPDIEGFYVVGLTVNDGLSDSIREDSFIDLLNNSNEPPVAVCGDPIVVEVGTSGILDGSNSADPEGSALTYQWNLQARPINSEADITNADQPLAQLNTDVTGLYRGELIVNDGLFNSEPCSQEVVAEEAATNRAPVADAGNLQSGKPGDTIVLDGTASYDPDGDPLTILWAFGGLPLESTLTNADITAADSLTPSIQPDVEGRYTLRINLSDGQLSASDTTDLLIAENDAPTADAGADSSLTLGDLATVDGSASTDPDGDPLTYLWSFLSVPSGSAITDSDLSNPLDITSRFSPDVPGQYNLSLSVTDGFLSDNDVVVVTANTTSSNNAPIADAGSDQQVNLGDPVALDGTGSSDPDGDPLLFAWSFVTVPTGSTLTDADITGAFSNSASFTPDVSGIFVLGLGAYDGIDYGTDTVIIQVGSTSGNNVPVADAGTDQSVQSGATVSLNASGSTDADGDPLSYFWVFDQLPTGSTLTDLDISQTGTAAASFVPDVNGVYTLMVGVSDSMDYDTDTVDITVSTTTSNNAPVADAGANQALNLGDSATLDASGSSDADGDPLTYAWVFGSLPNGSALVDTDIAQSGGTNATFTPDIAGVFTLLVAVTDGTDNDSDTVDVSVAGSSNTPPVADVGANQTLTLADTATLDGTASSDADGDPLTYLWIFSALPSGSALLNGDISNAASDNATFVPDVQGIYTLRLRVGDGTDFDTDALTLTVIGSNSPPVADAGANQNITLGAGVSLDGTGSTDPDGDPLTYQWLFANLPTNSQLTDSDITTSTASTANFTPDVTGNYTVRLRVHDGTYPANDYVGLVVTGPNTAPTARAGGDLNVTTGTLVTLDGSGSSDPEGDTLNFSWTLIAPANSSATVSNSSAEKPSFIADITGSYVAYLVVDDSVFMDSDIAAINATVSANSSPIADAGTNQSATSGSTVLLDGTGSIDPDGDPLTYEWIFSRLPSSSNLTDADISAASTDSASFAPDVNGSYRVRLKVNDGLLNATDQSVITVYASGSANAPPIADPGPSLVVSLGGFAEPDGSSSYDPDGDPITYDWSFLSLPASSTLTDADIVDYDTDFPTFSPDVTGSYILLLVVDDGITSTFGAVVIRVTNANNAPTADAGPTQTGNTGNPVTADGSASTDADGDPLTYTWTLSAPLGSNASLTNSANVSTTFTPDIVGTYELLLVVSDGQETDYDFLTVTIQ
jgi:hypothetical protein